MKYAIIENGVVANIAESDAALAENWVQVDDTVHIGYLYDGATFVPPAPVTVVPESVTRRQARQALLLRGKLSLVQPAIDAIPDATQRGLIQIEWDDSQVFERHRPTLIALATAIGLSADDLDDLFLFAATL